MGKAYYRTSAIGDFIPPLTKTPVSRADLVKFAAATKDYNPLNIDDEYARTHGYGSVFAQGNLVLSFIEEALYSFAENGRLLRLLGTFHRMVWPGDLLTAKALISDKYRHNKEPRIDLEVWVENQVHDVVVKGQATFLLWENQKAEAEHPRSLPRLSDVSSRDISKTIRAKLAGLSLVLPEDGEEEVPAKATKAAAKKRAARKKTTR